MDEIKMVREPILLNCLLSSQFGINDWLLHKVKDIQHCVGIEC